MSEHVSNITSQRKERHNQIINARMDGKTYKQIADEFGLTENYVGILCRSLEKKHGVSLTGDAPALPKGIVDDACKRYALQEVDEFGEVTVCTSGMLAYFRELRDTGAIHLTEYNPPRRMAQYAEPVRAIARVKATTETAP